MSCRAAVNRADKFNSVISNFFYFDQLCNLVIFLNDCVHYNGSISARSSAASLLIQSLGLSNNSICISICFFDLQFVCLFDLKFDLKFDLLLRFAIEIPPALYHKEPAVGDRQATVRELLQIANNELIFLYIKEPSLANAKIVKPVDKVCKLYWKLLKTLKKYLSGHICSDVSPPPFRSTERPI